MCDLWSVASQVTHTGKIDDVGTGGLRWRSGPLWREYVGEAQILDDVALPSEVNRSTSFSRLRRPDGTRSIGGSDSLGVPLDTIFSFPNRFPFLNTDKRFRKDCRNGEVFFSTLDGGVNKV